MAMAHVSVAKKKYHCPLLNLRKDYVSCHYQFGPHDAVVNVHVALSNFRNSNVALLILEVKGHLSVSSMVRVRPVSKEGVLMGSRSFRWTSNL